MYACYHEYTQMNFLFEWPILQVAHSVRTKRSRDKAAATKPIFADVDIYNGASEWVQFEIYYMRCHYIRVTCTKLYDYLMNHDLELLL